MDQKLSKIEYALLKFLSAGIHQTEISGVMFSQDEWKELMTLAHAHNVMPLIFEKATENESFVYNLDNTQYTMETMSIVAGQARRTEAFLSLYEQLFKENICPIVMKGLICRQLYGEYCDHRPSGDEDILIRKSEYKQVEKILQENGYISEYEDVTDAQLDDLQEVIFYNGQTSLSIEVHVNPIGHEDGWRRQLNDCFKDVFQHCREEVIDGV